MKQLTVTNILSKLVYILTMFTILTLFFLDEWYSHSSAFMVILFCSENPCLPDFIHAVMVMWHVATEDDTQHG